MAQMVKNLPAMQDTWVQSLDQEDPHGQRILAAVHEVARVRTQLSD